MAVTDLPNKADKVSVSDPGKITPGIKQPETPVNVGVPPQLHPDNVKGLFEEMLANGPEAASCRMAYSAASGAFKRAYEVATEMHETARALKQHEVVTSGKTELPHDIAVQAGTAMGAAFSRVAPMFETATNEVQEVVKSMTSAYRVEARRPEEKRSLSGRGRRRDSATSSVTSHLR